MNRRLIAIPVIAAAAGCVPESPAERPSRETLQNGAVLVRYPGLPAIDSVGPEITEAHVDLRIGTVDGEDPNYIFGDIRGVQAASDGTIYVLDYQAVEVRAYSRDGEHLRTIARRGEGPGEIMEANGILLSGDTLLWINDHGKYQIFGVDAAGEEVQRFDMPVRAYGYIWDGTFDVLGRFWKSDFHSDEEFSWPPELGYGAASFRDYYKSYHLSTEALDSVAIGESTYEEYVVETSSGGYRHYPIPFVAANVTVLDPAGGFWQANTGFYRLARTAESGDTLVVVEAGVSALPVTADDRSAHIQGIVDRRPEDRRAAEAIAALMPDFKPILESLFVDDEGRLWVERATPNEVPPFYDLFARDGDYLGSVRFAFEPRANSKVWVQHGNIYTWVVDELDTPFVVRAPVS